MVDSDLLPELRTTLATTCRSLGDARTLPAAVFTQTHIHDLEQRTLFASHWLAVAQVAEVEAVGSFVTKEVAGERILIVRDETGALHAFYNVCRHRGARLVDQAQGRLRGGIACPYHAWVYGFDGRLRRAPRLVVDADGDALALATMPLVVREGFVFVRLDGRSSAEPSLPALQPFGLDALVRVARLDYEVRCNWKIVCENYSECYHCPGVHPQLSRLSDLAGDGFVDEAGFNGGPMRLRRGIDTLSMSGRSDWQRLCDPLSEASSLIHYWLVYPNLMLGVHPDYLLVHRVWSTATDQCRVDCEVFVHPQTAAAAGFDPTPVVEFWDLTNRQDWALCAQVQQGVTSRGYRPGPYHPSERCVHAFDRWYAAWLLTQLDGKQRNE